MNSKPIVLELDLDSQQPLADQVSDGLKLLIRRGELVVGDLLPPVRQLAVLLGIHFNTVAGAYKTLQSEGYVESRGRRGTMVKSVPAIDANDRETLIHQAVADLLRTLRRYQASGLNQAQLAMAIEQSFQQISQEVD